MVRLKYMLEAAQEIISFTLAKKRSDFEKDRKLSLSIVRFLEIIGEAARGYPTTYAKGTAFYRGLLL